MTFEAPAARPHRGVPTWVITAGALLVLANLIGLAWLMLRQSPTTTNAPAAATTAAVASTTNAGAAAVASGGASAPPTAAGLTPDGTAAAASASTLLVPPEAESLQPELPEDARIASMKRYATLGNAGPTLRLDLHVYASNPADRYALINMRKLREGDTSEDGIRVKEITRSGVVLLYRGEELLLSRD
jgi:general secretion pathway protein B